MSWLFTSARGPLLLAMSYIQGWGTLGPRVTDLMRTGSPILPESSVALAATKSRA